MISVVELSGSSLERADDGRVLFALVEGLEEGVVPELGLSIVTLGRRRKLRKKCVSLRGSRYFRYAVAASRVSMTDDCCISFFTLSL